MTLSDERLTAWKRRNPAHAAFARMSRRALGLFLLSSITAACGDDTVSSDSATDTSSISSTTDTTETAGTTGTTVGSKSETETTSTSGVSDSEGTSSTTDPTTGEMSTTGTTSTTSETEGSTGITAVSVTDTDTDTGTTGEPPMCPDEDPGFPGESDLECKAEVKIGQFQPTVEWKKSAWSVHPTSTHISGTPIVASMNDDNQDGMINDEDIPDIIFVTSGVTRALRVVSGADGAELLSLTPPKLGNRGGVAVGDLDGDNAPEIVITCGPTVVALEHDGAIKWISPELTAADIGGVGSYAWPAISDMEGDGTPEVIIGRVILNHDGTLQGKGAHGRGDSVDVTAISFAVDLNDDGVQEVVVGNALYSPTGATIWYNGLADGFPAVGDFDSDGTPEIVVVTQGSIRLQKSSDGAVLWTSPIPGPARGGAPTIADFDGDGAPEIGVAGWTFYVVFDGDGSILWQRPIEENSGLTSSSVYDFEGDGVADVVYADTSTLWIFSGIDGAVKLEFKEHSSSTDFEYPVIVDVDGDDQVEIALASNGAYAGLTVIGDAGQSWRPGRKIWNQYSYHITNINDDGTIPTKAALNWKSYNNFRSGDLSPDGVAAPDLTFGDALVCEDECIDSVVVVSAHLGNIGASPLTGGATVEVITVMDGVETVIDTIEVVDALPPGTWLDGYLYELDPSGFEQVIFRVVAKEEECKLDNNEQVIDGPFCE